VAKAQENNIPMSSNVVGGMFGLFFTEAEAVTNFEQTCACEYNVPYLTIYVLENVFFFI
jgi:glutamate-1-semialdehyde aminotransferase